MIDLIPPVALLLILAWPLLLVPAVVLRATRAVALRLVPLAALPALVLALVQADSTLWLRGTLLESSLVLDTTGRVYLLLNAIVWLATGLLACRRLQAVAAARNAVLLLLAMAGSFGMSLAGDALLFFTAATLAAYALYGLLVNTADKSAHTAGRILVVLLVMSDLLVFELLLLLGHTAGSVQFPALRQAFYHADNQGLLLGLLIAAFGVKLGVPGVHFWLRPVFSTARTALLPALTGFVLGGLLGGLRLLPFGEMHWLGAGNVLHWLAWATLGYALVAGLVRTLPHHLQVTSMFPVLVSLWLATMASALQHPQEWGGLLNVILIAIFQSGLAMSALLLAGRHPDHGLRASPSRFVGSFVWLAAATLVIVPLVVAVTIANFDAGSSAQLRWIAAALSFLLVRTLLQLRHVRDAGIDTMNDTQSADRLALSVFGGLVLLAALAAFINLGSIMVGDTGYSLMNVFFAAVAGWLSVTRGIFIPPLFPAIAPHAPVGAAMARITARSRQLAEVLLPRMYAACVSTFGRAWAAVAECSAVDHAEIGLRRWRNALQFLVLLFLVMALLGSCT